MTFSFSLGAIGSAALLLATTPAFADPAPPKRAVDVRTTVEDALTTKFADGLRAALPASETLRVQTPDEEDDLQLAILSNVQPDGKRFVYAVDLFKVHAGFTPDRVGSLAGKCRADAMPDCAKRVVSDAERAVRKADKD